MTIPDWDSTIRVWRMDLQEQIEIARLIKEARELPDDVVENLSAAQKYQLARVREDVSVGD